MDSPVRRLFDLQEKLTRLKQRREDREKMPPEVAGLDREFQAKQKSVVELRTRIEAQRTEKLDVDRLLEEAGGKLTKYQGQLMSVRTNKEYSAALNEIDMARKEIKTLEDRSLGLGIKLEADEAELKTHDDALPAEQAAFEERIGGWRSYQAKCDADILQTQADIEAIEKELPKALASQFRKIFELRGGVAVVQVTGPSCGGCNVRLRPALFQTLRLRSSREIIPCENCKRILFYDGDASDE